MLQPLHGEVRLPDEGQEGGRPLLEETDVGPQARADLRDALHRQVSASVAAGARLLLGGTVPAGEGAFYPPTVLAGVRPGMPAFDEETFGPVAAIVEAEDEADAVRLANHSSFGLGAAVFTTDRERGEKVASRLQAGQVFVNGLVASDPRLPFGGIKESGYGRELAEPRHQGVRERQDRLRQVGALPPHGHAGPEAGWFLDLSDVWPAEQGLGPVLALRHGAVRHGRRRGRAAAGGAGRRSPWLYALAAAGVAGAIALAFVLTRLLGGAALVPEDVPERAARAAAPPLARPAPVAPDPAPPPTTVPQIADATPPPVAATRPPDNAPSPTPAAVYGPYGGVRSPGYSIPAPPRPSGEAGRTRAGGRAADVRAREQAVRTARDRFARAERALAAAEGGDAETEATAMEELEDAARELREAESALDRARRRPPRS